MNNKNNNKPELLAPAGNLNCALAALQSGADAVYAGISRFNAREMGENFTFDDMSRLSAYTKKQGKKLYLTLNTLIKEHELSEFAESVSRIAALKPDAVIVQDIGVVRMLRDYFPELPIHGSTQMGIHNSAGVKTAAEMGMERVILERQLTNDELKTICAGPTEIEVFVHGALCCSISGHCLFSSWMGGWSGNRGRCKQPCRRRYHGEEHGSKKSGFFFSTQDYYSLDMLDTLTDAGVCSLKIEGRLKKPDYVKSVVTAYRMMLDAPPEEKPVVIKEARSILAGSYGRMWSHGFSSLEDMRNVLQYTSAGVSGRLVGTVEKAGRNGFEMSVIQRLHIGDRIRVQPKSGDEGPSITVTKMSVDRSSVKSATKGTRVFINCDKEVQPSSNVYKIGESTAETVKRPADLPLFSPPVNLKISISVKPAGISAEIIEINGKSPAAPLKWSQEEAVDAAQNRPLSPDDLTEAFQVTRNPALSAANLSAETEDGLFLPAGRLKKTRRAFWEWLEEQDEVKTAVAEKDNKGEDPRLELIREALAVKPGKNSGEPGRPAVYNPGGMKTDGIVPGKDSLRLSGIRDFDNKTDEIILPFFCPESELDELRKLTAAAIKSGIRRFRITSLYQLDFFKDTKDVVLSSSYPLPTANSFAAAEMAALGISRAQIWLELDSTAITQAAAAWPVKPEIYRRGRPFLLATRAALDIEGRITDSRGKSFDVENDCRSDLDFTAPGAAGSLGCVFPEEVLSLPRIKGCDEFFDFSRIREKDVKETSFNYDFSLI
ncbi:MAG: U32 family peptidase [Spirochaetales bacterium]|nr:U32 family peptidase [Spirochaetales bacterium]